TLGSRLVVGGGGGGTGPCNTSGGNGGGKPGGSGGGGGLGGGGGGPAAGGGARAGGRGPDGGAGGGRESAEGAAGGRGHARWGRGLELRSGRCDVLDHHDRGAGADHALLPRADDRQGVWRSVDPGRRSDDADLHGRESQRFRGPVGHQIH